VVALPAARSNAGFAVFYSAARLLADVPAALARVYEDAWFVAKLNQLAMPGVYDVFFYNPPTLSLMLLPLAPLGPAAARLIWTLMGLPLLAAGLVLLARGLGLPAGWGFGALPVTLLYAPVTANLRAGQAYLLLFFLLCAVFWGVVEQDGGRWTMSDEQWMLRLRSGQAMDDGHRDTIGQAQPSIVYHLSSFLGGWKHEAVAGLALALMLVLKVAGAWLWPLLLLAGRRRTLAWAGLVAAGLALASLPWIGLGTWHTYLALLPGAAGDPKRTVTAYQTVTSLFGHLLDYDARWNPAPIADAPWAAAALTLIASLSALGLTAWWQVYPSLSPRRSDNHQDTKAPRCFNLSESTQSIRFWSLGALVANYQKACQATNPELGVRRLTLALAMSLVATNAPFAEEYHYTLVLPSLLVAAWWVSQARVGLIGLALLALAALLLGAPLAYESARLQGGWVALLAYPRVYGAYLLWGWLAWALWRARSNAYCV
jgi:hypothetical protein